MRLVFAEKTTVLGFDSNDSIHSNQITNRMATWLNEKEVPLTFIRCSKWQTKERRLGQPSTMTVRNRHSLGSLPRQPERLPYNHVGGFPQSARGVAMLRGLPLKQRAQHTSDPTFPPYGTLFSAAL